MENSFNTLKSASMADISIKGDAFFGYANNGSMNADNVDTNRVRLQVTGKSGGTTVNAQLRTTGTNSDAGSAYFDILSMSTKIGDINVKAGDFYGTVGLGARSATREKDNALSLSTKVGDIKVGMFTHNGSAASGSSSTNVSAAGKIGGAAVKVIHNPSSDWTDVSLKGTFNGILVAAELWDDGSDTDNDTTLIHVGGKAGDFKWDVAQLKNDTVTASNHRFAPLGSMLVGTGARGGTSTAVANTSDFTKITGVAVSTKVVGNTVKAIYTKNTLGADDKVTGTELILTRDVSGAKLTANLAKLSGHDTVANNGTNKGIRFDVKF